MSMTAECPKDWYKEEEMKVWLKREGYPFNRDLPRFLATHLQKAFERGWQLCESACRAHASAALEAAAKVADMDHSTVGDKISAAIRALKDL